METQVDDTDFEAEKRYRICNTGYKKRGLLRQSPFLPCGILPGRKLYGFRFCSMTRMQKKAASPSREASSAIRQTMDSW